MGYYSREALEAMNFKSLGKRVMISEKACIYQPEKLSIGDDCRIDDFCVLLGDITLGRHVHIAMFVHIGGGNQGVVIDDFVSVAYRSSIATHSDDYSLQTLSGPTIPAWARGGDEGGVYVGKYVIIGTNSFVMPGSYIGEGTTVGAFSLVKGKLDDFYLYAGRPVRKIRENSRECINLAKRVLESEKYIEEN